MKVWLIWVMAEDGVFWLEAAMDDDTTAESGGQWESEVQRVRKLVSDNKDYEMRIQAVHVPKVHDLFRIPEVEAESA